MSTTSELLRLEKLARSKMVQVRFKTITPAESGIGKVFLAIKPLDEPLYNLLLTEYKTILSNL